MWLWRVRWLLYTIRLERQVDSWTRPTGFLEFCTDWSLAFLCFSIYSQYGLSYSLFSFDLVCHWCCWDGLTLKHYCFLSWVELGYRLRRTPWLTLRLRLHVVMTPNYYFRFSYGALLTVDVLIYSLVFMRFFSLLLYILKLFSSFHSYWSWMGLQILVMLAVSLRSHVRLVR